MADDPDIPDTPEIKDAKARIKTALERFKLGAEAQAKQRARETAALEFQVPEKQWPKSVRDQLQGQVVNGVALPAEPMLSIPSLDQPLQLVTNQEKAASLGVQIHSLSEDADDDTAEVLQGLYRRIEVDSRASLARSWAFDRAVKAGTGEYEVTTVYDEESGSQFDQKIVIKRILHQQSVVRDPFAEEPDWSDGMWAFKVKDMAWDTYKQKYPKSTLKTYSDSDLDALAQQCPDWITGTGAGRAIRVAAYYEIRITEETVTEGQQSRDVEKRTLWYSIINAIEELEPASEQNGKYIPLIPAIGRELIPFDGERRWQGIIEPNMDAARMLNYAASKAVKVVAIEPNNQWVVAEGQDEGHEQEFQLANVRNFAVVHYKPTSLLGQPVAPPTRSQADTSKLQMSMMLLQQAREFLHSGTGAFEAALGQSASQNKTKGGILALQQQHQQGSSDFLDNEAEITTPYEAKVVLDLIPHIYDRPGRIARILDKLGQPKTVMLNQPYTMDPQTKRPVAVQSPQGPQMPPVSPAGGPMAGPPPPQMTPGANGNGQKPKVLHYDLKKGRYGITVSIGKSYKSAKEQGMDVLGQIIQADPALLNLAGDIYFKLQDFDGHMELSERFKRMLPPQAQGQDDPQAAQQQLSQLQAKMKEMGGVIQQLQDVVKTEKVKYDAQVEIEKVKQQGAIELQHVKNAAPISVAWINAQTKGVLSDHEAKDEALATGLQLTHEAVQNEHDRQHEAAMAAMGQDHALEQGQQGALTDATMASQGHQQDLQAGDQAHQQAMQQADQGHQQTMDQQQQAADLAPPPAAGA